MSIQVSTTHWLSDLFQDRGWARVPTPYESRRFGSTIMVEPQNQHTAVIVGAVKLRPPQLARRDLQEQFSDWLHQLVTRLERRIVDGPSIQHIFFTGGGPVTLPRWFRDWCEGHAITIHTVSTDTPPPHLDIFM